MTTGNVWGSANKVFGPGREGDILLVAGGNLQTKVEDDIGFAEHGLVIRHNDPADTITLIPWVNILSIRTNLTPAAMREKKQLEREMEMTKNHTRPVIDASHKALNE